MSRSTQSSEELLADAIAQAFAGESYEDWDSPPPPPTPPPKEVMWYPDLNPTQDKIFNDPATNILGYGEKGSGKTIGFAHKIIRHAYENNNALVLIIAPSMRTGNEGIWHDIENLVLPQWGKGIGLEYTHSKLDPNTKDRHRWIRNRFGGWSKLLLMSIPYASQVQNRVKGPAPSMVYVDELTNCESREYYTYTAAQLMRRRDISGPMQFCASCNPEGESHWVYQLFFVDPVDEATGQRDPDFAVYHVPFTENAHRMPGYKEHLEKILKGDPIERQRLLEGKWIDRPTGDAFFKEFFIPSLHVRGDVKTGQGLLPVPGFPLILGYDLGQVFSSVTFEQLIPTKSGKSIWLIIDEIDHLGEKILYKKLAHEIIEKIRFWRRVGEYKFKAIHITDESAINQWRPNGEGSYDAWEFEREFQRETGDKVKMLGCPKGDGSVQARIRMFQAKLYQEEILISDTCPNRKQMVMHLEADKKDPEKPKRNKWIHPFDSTTYPMFKMDMGYARNVLQSGQTAPRLIRCGSGVTLK